MCTFSPTEHERFGPDATLAVPCDVVRLASLFESADELDAEDAKPCGAIGKAAESGTHVLGGEHRFGERLLFD